MDETVRDYCVLCGVKVEIMVKAFAGHLTVGDVWGFYVRGEAGFSEHWPHYLFYLFMWPSSVAAPGARALRYPRIGQRWHGVCGVQRSRSGG